MSHELRTPLNSVMILARLLAENASDHLDDDEVQSAVAIESAGADLLALIDDILDISRIEAGRLSIEVGPVEPGRVVRALERLFLPVAEQRGLGLELRLDPSAPGVVVTDERRLLQILRNLLANAIKFTDEGRVTLRAAPHGDGGLSFTVRDTGPGIAEADLERIFESFYQADGSLSRRHSGTGLGLAIARQLAEAIGGRLTAASEPGEGATFVLELPATTPASSAAERRPAVAAPREPLRDAMLLIIEDDPSFGVALEQLARASGFSALLADNGEQGIAMCIAHRPTCVLVDLKLPGISGEEVIHVLDEDPRTSDIPKHVMSGHARGDVDLPPGAVSFLAKPFRAETFQRFLDSALATGPSSRPVLLLERDPTEVLTLTQLFAEHGIRCLAAFTPTEAIRIARDRPVACVMVGVDLDGGWGLDFLSERRDDPALHSLPVLVITDRPPTPADQRRLGDEIGSVILRDLDGRQRLLEETALFPVDPPRPFDAGAAPGRPAGTSRARRGRRHPQRLRAASAPPHPRARGGGRRERRSRPGALRGGSPFRRDPHGPDDAGGRRPRGHPADPRLVAGRGDPDHRPHRQGDGRGSECGPGRWLQRVHQQARRQPGVAHGPPGGDPAMTTRDGYERILVLLRDRWGYDFAGYVRPLFEKASDQLVQSHRLTSLDALEHRIREDGDFVRAIVPQLTTSYSQLFREPPTLRALTLILASRFRRRPTIRIWDAGCATGEMTFSLAILLDEASLLGKCELVATDIDDRCLVHARRGRYRSAAIEAARPPYAAAGGRRGLDVAFVRVGAVAQVRDALRSRVDFVAHSLTSDPPFEDVAVVMCCNTLMYFDDPTRRAILSGFAEALLPGGILGLGQREGDYGWVRELGFERLGISNVFVKQQARG